jgi:hypothetical protein
MDRRQLLFGASALGLVTNLNLNHPLIAQVGTAVMGSRCLSDRERAGLRGPVKTCSELIGRRIESINTDYSPDGRLLGQRVRVRDFPGPFPGVTTGLSGISGGTEETWEFYDEQGKKTKVLRVSCRPSYVTDEFHYDEQGKKTRVRKVCLSFNQPDFPDVMLDSIKFEVAEAGGSLVGSSGGTVTTRYNENDQPIESLVRNSGGELLTKINHNYTNGRLISETLVIVRLSERHVIVWRQMLERFSENEQERESMAKTRAALDQRVLPFVDHTSTCAYPDTQCTCSLGPEIPEIDALCKCGHPRRFHAQRGDGTPQHGPCYLHRTEVKTCPCDHFEAARGDIVGLA